jgi:salicylate hydroxylase
MGPDAHAVTYLLNNSDILNVVVIRKQRSDENHVTYGPQQASLEDLQREFDTWDPALRELLHVPGKPVCTKWHLLQMNTLESWRQAGETKFCLIGDAAHAMPPYLAQGAAQAFEDAAVLGAIFALVSDKTHISRALKTFEALRKPRTEKVREHTLGRKVMYGLQDGLEQQERDQMLARGPGEESPDNLARPEFQKWLWGYDAAADGARAWEQQQN